MTDERNERRERAYRFDLLISTDWGERFDVIMAEHVKLPKKGRLLEVNCGTGSWAIEHAAELLEGEVVGTDEDPERIAIATAKAGVSPLATHFLVANPEALDLEADSFDAVVIDASLTKAGRLASMVTEAIRVARVGAPVVVKAALRGSFDEFYSLYWEALHDAGLDENVWSRLEQLITRLPTLQDAISTLKSAGVKGPTPHRSKEEWRFSSAKEFLTSPLILDHFLTEWVEVLPVKHQPNVMRAVAALIDREVDGHYFEVSVNAAVFKGHK